MVPSLCPGDPHPIRVGACPGRNPKLRLLLRGAGAPHSGPGHADRRRLCCPRRRAQRGARRRQRPRGRRPRPPGGGGRLSGRTGGALAASLPARGSPRREVAARAGLLRSLGGPGRTLSGPPAAAATLQIRVIVAMVCGRRLVSLCSRSRSRSPLD